MIKKERLDLILVNRNLVQSRQTARFLIMTGKVFVNGDKELKPGTKIDINSKITVNDSSMKYVSRGGYKLEKAIDKFKISVKDKVCMDIGASTGGFTDCMLQNGAKKVFSIDVGYGQFNWNLRNDKRVVCMERTNVRYLNYEDIGEYSDFASIDVSFISLTKILIPTKQLLKDSGSIVCLIKPQFEAGKENVGKKGVVKDKNIHIDVISNIVKYCKSIDLNVINLDYSPIKGPEGNIEYLLYLDKNCDSDLNTDNLIYSTVEQSHKFLE